MKKYNFDTIIDRANDPYSYSFKWESGERMKKKLGLDEIPEDRICLQTADMDFQTAPEIIEAMVNVAKHGIYGYSNITPKYKQAVCDWYQRRQGWTFKPENVKFVPGTHSGVRESVKRLTQPNEGVIVLTPSYSYHGDVDAVGRIYVPVELINDHGYYTIDFDALETALENPNNTMFIICHPHNPTGRIWTKEELIKMAELSRKHNVVMLTDEVHSDIIRAGLEFHPMMKVVGPENLIAYTAVNKTFNLAGLAMTNMIIEDEALKERFGSFFSLPSPFGIAAVIAAYNKGEAWVDELNEYLDENLNYAINFIKEKMPRAKCVLPEGGYIIWIDFSGYGLSDEEIQYRVLNKAHLILQGGKNFDDPRGNQIQRMCLPSPKSVIVEAFDRLYEAFEK